MSFNGSGTYVRAIASWVTDALSFPNLTASRFDTENDAFATGLSNAICKDGQTVLVAHIPFATFKITGLGDATAAKDALNRDSGDARYIQSAKSGGDAGIFTNTGLKILDTNASHSLIVSPGSDLTANRTLTVTTGDADRTISIAGNVTTAGAFTTSGAYGVTFTFTNTTGVTFPTTGTLATLAGTETFTNKFYTPRVTSATSSATPTPNADTTDLYILTAQAAAAAFGAPGGTPAQGQKLIIRIKDNGTARALTWNAAYRASSDLPLPTTTTLSKTMYAAFFYNSTDSVWDMVSQLDNF